MKIHFFRREGSRQSGLKIFVVVIMLALLMSCSSLEGLSAAPSQGHTSAALTPAENSAADFESIGLRLAVEGNDKRAEEFLRKALEDDPCLLYTSPSPRDRTRSRMPSSA